MATFTFGFNRQQYLYYLTNNEDQNPRATMDLVERSNGTWVVDGTHSLSRYAGEDIFQVQQAQRICQKCGDMVVKGISGFWTDTFGSAQCEPMQLHDPTPEAED